MIRRVLLLFATALVLGSCTAARFSTLQSDFARLQDTRLQCRSAKDAQQALVCGAGESASFVDVARAAAKAAGEAADERTRIALLRLAATAGWESRDPAGLDIAEAAADDGIRRCNALPQDRFGVPRDCALLRIAPGIVVHVRTFVLLESVRGRASLTDADRRELAMAGADYVRNAWGVVDQARRNAIDGQAAVHPSVTSWLDQQNEAFYCTAVQLAEVNAKYGIQPGRDAVLRQLDPFVSARPALANIDCGRLR